MGVRFYDDKENMSSGDDYTTTCTTSTTNTTRTSCNCNTNTCNPPTTTDTTATQTTSNTDNGNNLNFQKSGSLREIIGNCKEVRIEENAHNLRIVGNNNRIRITFNVGDISVIGNNTRLKIKTNHGLIKYTGNDGRICMGKDSTEQLVDYSGCNGVLKVQNSKNSSQLNHKDDNNEVKNNTATRNTLNNEYFINSKKSKVKYASYGGLPSDSEVFKSHTDYNNIFNRKKSMPNMTTTKTPFGQNMTSTSNQQQPKSIVNNFGNIVIANSSNICITPYSYIS